MDNSFLYREENGVMHCVCPKCGEIVCVCENDRKGTLKDGASNYFVRCDDCGMWFNASTEF